MAVMNRGTSISHQLYLSSDQSDVTIRVVGDSGSWRFPGHKFFLTSQSPVFKVMLEGENFLEGKTGEILIEDSDPLTVKLFLRYLYTGELDLKDWVKVLKVICLAHRYEIRPLLGVCVRLLHKLLNLDNVCQVLQHAQKLGIQELENSCLALIDEAAPIVMHSEDFLFLGKECIRKIVRREKLNVAKETEVFWALWRWGESHCHRKTTVVSDYNIFEEIEELLIHINFSQISEIDRKLLPKVIFSPDRFDGGKAGSGAGHRAYNRDPSHLLRLSSVLKLDDLMERDICFTKPTLDSARLEITLCFSVMKPMFLTGFKGLYGIADEEWFCRNFGFDVYLLCESKTDETFPNIRCISKKVQVVWREESIIQKEVLMILTRPVLLAPSYVYTVRLSSYVRHELLEFYKALRISIAHVHRHCLEEPGICFILNSSKVEFFQTVFYVSVEKPA